MKCARRGIQAIRSFFDDYIDKNNRMGAKVISLETRVNETTYIDKKDLTQNKQDSIRDRIPILKGIQSNPRLEHDHIKKISITSRNYFIIFR